MTQEVVAAPPPKESSPPRRPWSVAAGLGRLVIGILVALAVNVVVLAVAIPLGFYLDRVYLTVAAAEGVLLLACLVATVTLGVRRRKGLGLGLVLGWAAGYVGFVAAVVLVFAAIAAVLIGLIVVWWFFALLLGAR